MTITRLKLERFTAFESLDLAPSPGVNVLVGANGAGKTHLMKAAYAACEASKPGVRFAEKLVGVFMPSGGDIRRLVKRRGGRSRCSVLVHRGRRRLRIEFDNRSTGSVATTAAGRAAWSAEPVESVYIPEKDVLANAPGFLSLHGTREVHFDETHSDLLVRAYLLALRDPHTPERERLLVALQKRMGGEFTQETKNSFCAENAET